VTATVRVYINANALEVSSSATTLEAVEAWDAEEAAAIRNGERMITDSRGLPADPQSPVHNGAIFRIVRARQLDSDDADVS
jgi:hypothetical protein